MINIFYVARSQWKKALARSKNFPFFLSDMCTLCVRPYLLSHSVEVFLGVCACVLWGLSFPAEDCTFLYLLSNQEGPL